jgi:hypothetical protein
MMSSGHARRFVAWTAVTVLLAVCGCSTHKNMRHVMALSYFPFRTALDPPEPVPNCTNPLFHGYEATCWRTWPVDFELFPACGYEMESDVLKPGVPSTEPVDAVPEDALPVDPSDVGPPTPGGFESASFGHRVPALAEANARWSPRNNAQEAFVPTPVAEQRVHQPPMNATRPPSQGPAVRPTLADKADIQSREFQPIVLKPVAPQQRTQVSNRRPTDKKLAAEKESAKQSITEMLVKQPFEMRSSEKREFAWKPTLPSVFPPPTSIHTTHFVKSAPPIQFKADNLRQPSRGSRVALARTSSASRTRTPRTAAIRRPLYRRQPKPTARIKEVASPIHDRFIRAVLGSPADR